MSIKKNMTFEIYKGVFMNNKGEGLGLGKITMFAVGATLASGVFSLSGDFAASGAYPLAVLIGWGISGLGMLMLTLCFFRLSVVRPDLTSGLYSYAKTGFGEYIGFNSAWGFWLSALLGNLSFITLFFASLGNFFPIFGSGTNLISVILGSVIVWAFGLLVLGGVNEAIAINTVVVIAKVIPIAVMIVAIVYAGSFDFEIFSQNITGEGSGMNLMEQVKATVYTTVWVFIGIEGAVVISGRAKNTSVAGKATILAFISLFILYVLISILSMGVMTTEELAALGNPPMAFVLKSVVGSWGSALVNIGVIISVGGALFTYTILCVDSIYAPAMQRCFPKSFTKQNKKGAPISGVLITTLVTQFFLIIIYFNDATYQVIYAVSTSAIMVPYALSAFYCLKVTAQGQGLDQMSGGRKFMVWVYSILGSAYGIWMLYAGGVTHLLISALLYAPGTILYIIARREQKGKIFPRPADKITFVFLIAMALLSAYLLAKGEISI